MSLRATIPSGGWVASSSSAVAASTLVDSVFAAAHGQTPTVGRPSRRTSSCASRPAGPRPDRRSSASRGSAIRRRPVSCRCRTASGVPAGAVDVDPRPGLGGLLPDPSERDERDLLLLQPAVPRIMRLGLRQHEPVHEPARVQVVVHGHAVDAGRSGEQQDVPPGALRRGAQRVQELVHHQMRLAVRPARDAVPDQLDRARPQTARVTIGPVVEQLDRPVTRSSVSGRSRCGAFSALDTVCTETSAWAATCFSVATTTPSTGSRAFER